MESVEEREPGDAPGGVPQAPPETEPEGAAEPLSDLERFERWLRGAPGTSRERDDELGDGWDR